MRNAKAKVHALIDEMPSTAVGSILQLLTTFKPGGDLKDVDGEVKTRRSRRSKVEDETPAKSTRRSRRSAKAEADEEKPTRSRRRRAKVEEPEEDEDDDFEATIDGLEAFMDSFEGEPVEGTLKSLRAGLEEYGIDADLIVEKGATNEEKKEEFGIALAAMHELLDKLVGAGKDALAELAEDLGAETARSAKATAMNILVAFNSDEDEDDEDEEGDEDEDEPEEKPTRTRRSRKAKAEAEDEDEDEADEDEGKSTRRSRRSKVKDDDNDLGDLEDAVKSTRRRRRANV